MFTSEQLRKATARAASPLDGSTDEGYLIIVALCALRKHDAAELTEKYGTVFSEMVNRLADD